MARAMKDSGVPWIGDIPVEWDIGKVSYFFDIQLGKMLQPEPHDTTDTLEDYLCAANLGGNQLKTDSLKKMWFSQSEKNKFEVRKGDLLVVEGGDVASCDIVADDVKNLYIQNALHRVRSCNGSDVRILRYLLILAKSTGYIDLICNKATIAHFTKDKFASVPFLAIPVEEQHRIADFLDTECSRIDSVIEKTRASIEEYKKLKQAVITEAVTKGIRPGRAMKDSRIEWIGKIPFEWRIVKITRLLDYSHAYPIGDGDHGLIKADSYTSEGVPYLRVQNLGWGTDLQLDDIVYISESDNDRIRNSILRPNDVLFAKTGATIGKTGLIPDSLPISNTTSHIGKLTIDPKYNPKYVFYVLSSYVGYRQFWEIAAQKTTRPELSIDETKTIKIIIPESIEEQNEIVDYLDNKVIELNKLIDKKEQLLFDLESYKKSLIYEYVTGKKEVQ